MTILPDHAASPFPTIAFRKLADLFGLGTRNVDLVQDLTQAQLQSIAQRLHADKGIPDQQLSDLQFLTFG